MKIPEPPTAVIEIAFWLSLLLLTLYITKVADSMLPPDPSKSFTTTTAR